MTAYRILHVDDEPDIREIVDMSLGLNAEFEVRACACGADAIAMAAEWSPFLILLDVMMPGMDGPTTLKHLRQDPRTADIPVLFMTARAQEREVQQLIALGAHGVISKPFDPMTLAFAVRSHLQAIRLDSLRAVFVQRIKGDAALLAACRSSLGETPIRPRSARSKRSPTASPARPVCSAFTRSAATRQPWRTPSSRGTGARATRAS
jgi:CheY-like chemotaxis protein